METMEIVVYLLVAVIIGSLIIMFISSVDYKEFYDSAKKIFSDDKSSFENIKGFEFPRVAYDTWNSGGLGSINFTKTIYLTDDSEINNSVLFNKIKEYNLCKSLQSKTNDCGSREDVLDFDIKGPSIVVLRCENNLLNITS